MKEIRRTTDQLAASQSQTAQACRFGCIRLSFLGYLGYVKVSMIVETTSDGKMIICSLKHVARNSVDMDCCSVLTPAGASRLHLAWAHSGQPVLC